MTVAMAWHSSSCGEHLAVKWSVTPYRLALTACADVTKTSRICRTARGALHDEGASATKLGQADDAGMRLPSLGFAADHDDLTSR